MKDWTGNGLRSVYTTLGASSHTEEERETHDYYATHPSAAEHLLALEDLTTAPIWEPACGEGHLADVFRARGHAIICSDLIVRDYPCKQVDFLTYTGTDKPFHIVTNPPYKYAQEFVEKSLSIVREGHLVCMFLKLTFLEGKRRRAFFAAHPLTRLWVSSSRIPCAMNGDFTKLDGTGSAVAYGWFIWQKGYTGQPAIGWFN